LSQESTEFKQNYDHCKEQPFVKPLDFEASSSDSVGLEDDSSDEISDSDIATVADFIINEASEASTDSSGSHEEQLDDFVLADSEADSSE